MAQATAKEVSDLSKIFLKLSKAMDKNTKASEKILDLTNEQLKAIQRLSVRDIGSSFGMDAYGSAPDRKVFESQKKQDEYMNEAIAKEEELAQMKADNSEDQLNDYLEKLGKKDKAEDKINKKSDNLRAKRLKDGLGGAKAELQTTFDYVKQITGLNGALNTFKNIQGAIIGEFAFLIDMFNNLLFSPLKATFSVLKGIGGFIFGGDSKTKKAKETEKKVETETKQEQQGKTMIDLMNQVVLNTSPVQEMKKGGNILDILKKFIPKKMFDKMGGGSLKGLKVAGAGMLKVVGAGMILGGVAWMISDFIEGFQEGGVKGGLTKALAGKLDNTIESAFKNAGKFAMIGAGIGLLIGGPVGGITGGLIGGAIGLLLNTIGSIFTNPNGITSGLTSFVYGESKGWVSTLFQGAKYASIFGLVGFAMGGPLGGLAGGLIGFVVGGLINFIYQILPQSWTNWVFKFWSKTADLISDGFNWAAEKAGEIWGGIKKSLSDTYTRVGDDWKKMYNGLVEGFNWILDKLGLKESFESFKTNLVTTWNKLKDKLTEIIDWVSDIFEFVSAGISTFLSSISVNFETWANGGEETKKKSTTGKKEAKKKSESGGFFSSLFGGGDSSSSIPQANSQAEVKTVQIQEKQETHQIEIVKENVVGNDLARKANEHLKNLSEFIQNDLVQGISNVFSEHINSLYKGLVQLEYNKGAFDAFKTGGATAMGGYTKKYIEFSEEMEKLGKNKKTTENISDAMNVISNTGNQIVNNNNYGGMGNYKLTELPN